MFFSIKVVNYGHGRGNFSTPFSPLLIGVYALPGTIAAKSKFFVRQPRLFISPTGRGRGRGQNISRSTNSTGWLPLAPLVCHSHPSVVRPPSARHSARRNLSFTGSSSISNAITLQGRRETNANGGRTHCTTRAIPFDAQLLSLSLLRNLRQR